MKKIITNIFAVLLLILFVAPITYADPIPEGQSYSRLIIDRDTFEDTPWEEVDCSNPNGDNVDFSTENTVAEETISNETLIEDYSLPLFYKIRILIIKINILL